MAADGKRCNSQGWILAPAEKSSFPATCEGAPRRIAAGSADRIRIYVPQLLYPGRFAAALRAGFGGDVAGAFELSAGLAGQRLPVAHGGHVSVAFWPACGIHRRNEPPFRAGGPAQRRGPAGCTTEHQGRPESVKAREPLK